LAAVLYLVGFYQRVAPAVLTNELQREFSLSAAALGNLSAFYFYSYVAVQIPTGLLADRWGPRRLLTCGAGFAAMGMLLFGVARDVALANAGRAMVGAGVGVAYVALLKLASVWLPPKRFTFAAAAALSVGVLGAAFAGAPLRAIVSAFGWREVMIASAGFGLLLMAAIWLVVRDDPTERGYLSHAPAAAGVGESHVLADLAAILAYRNTWFMLLMPGAVTAMLLSFAGLWGVPFLVTHYGMSTTTAAAFASLVMVGWAVGSVAIAPLSDKLGRRKPLYFGSVFLVMTVWCGIILPAHMPRELMAVLCFLLGFTGGAFTIGFAWAKESVPLRYAGTVSGIANVGSMVGPMIGQPLVGWALDHRWEGALQGGARAYDQSAYRFAFAILLLWGGLSLLLTLLARETFCKQGV
jgi:MFS family permease